MSETASYLLVFDRDDVEDSLRQRVQRIIEESTDITVEFGEMTRSGATVLISVAVLDSHPLEATILYHALDSLQGFRHVQRTSTTHD